MSDEIADRIVAAADAANLNLADLARKADLPARNYVSRLRRGEIRGRRHMAKIAEVLHVDLHWLLTGDLSVAPSWVPRPAPPPPPAELVQRITDQEGTIRELTRQLEQERIARRVAEQLLEYRTQQRELSDDPPPKTNAG